MKHKQTISLLVLLFILSGGTLQLYANKSNGMQTKAIYNASDTKELTEAITTAKKALSTYKTSIQDGDYYAGTDSKHGLKSHYFVDGTERTSQKGLECSQDQIDALKVAINEAEALLADDNATADALKSS